MSSGKENKVVHVQMLMETKAGTEQTDMTILLNFLCEAEADTSRENFNPSFIKEKMFRFFFSECSLPSHLMSVDNP